MAEKRKRQSTGTERPSKRTAIDIPELGPVIASTPGLSLSAKTKFSSYYKSGKGSRSHELLLHSSNHGQLDYTAKEDTAGPLKHYVGIYDPKTKKLKVVEAQKLTVRTSLRRETIEAEQEQARQKAEAERPTNRSLRNALTSEFGGAKAKKMVNALTENAITTDHATGTLPTSNAVTAALLSDLTKTTASMPSAEAMQATIADSRPRPKANLTATNLEDIYPLDVLIPRSTFAALEVADWLDSPTSQTVTSRFVSLHLARIAADAPLPLLKALRFMYHLIQFHASLSRKHKPPFRVAREEVLEKQMSGAPRSVRIDILKRFAEHGAVSKFHLDLLGTHICALALHVCNFDVDIFALFKDLAREPKEIVDYFKELGCKVTLPTEAERRRLDITKAEVNDHKHARLRVPLVFPVIKARGMRR